MTSGFDRPSQQPVRRPVSITLVAVLACVIGIALGTTAQAGSRTQIDFMPIGNSITDGDLFAPGFRDDLQALLAGEPQHLFAWVGDTGSPPLEGHFQGGREIEDFYPSSFGNGWGNGTFDTTPALGPPSTPNMVAIHLGTNDLNSQLPPYAPYSIDHGQTLNPSQPAELAEYLLYLLQWQDGTMSSDLEYIVLSTIIPMEGRDQDVADFNSAVVAMSEDFAEGTVTGSPVRIAVANHYDHFMSNPALFTYGPGDWMIDNLHPNDEGYTEMALIYHGSIMAALDDDTPPAFVNDLAVAEFDSNSAVLNFTAVGDDGMSGQAERYDLRIATYPIDNDNFALTQQVRDEPAPSTSGTPEEIELTGLLPGSTYYFALKVTDRGGNRSDISNTVSVTTTGTPTVTMTLREGLNGYFGVEDNSMIDFRNEDNQGAASSFSVGKHGSGEALITDIHRSLIRFDLSQIPASATILQATLEAYNYETETSSPLEVGAYRLTKRWVEGNRSLPEPQNGASCWDAARLGELAWSVPGAGSASNSAQNDDPLFDRYATPEDVATLTGASDWYAWDLTNAVEKWVTGEWNNDGVLLMGLTEPSDSRRRFYSSEATASQTLRPTLTVTFEVGEIAVVDPAELAPVAARLSAAYPNPFASSTMIRYQLADPQDVQLRVYDVRGRLVRVLASGLQMRGDHRISWDGLTESGGRAASGIYFYRLETTTFEETRKVVLAN